MFKISLFLSTLILIPFITPIAYCGWESQQAALYDVYVGGALCKDPYSTHLYALCGNATNKFLTYNYSSPYWYEGLTSTVPEGVIFDDGACMTAMGGEQGKFLLFVSNENTGEDEAYLFHKFFIYRGRQGQIACFPNFWQQFPGPPFDLLDPGAALTTNCHWSTPINWNDIYALEGQGQGFFRTSLGYPENLAETK